MVTASGDDTLRTTGFDIVRGDDWPAGITGRVLVNAFARRWHGHEAALTDNLLAQRAICQGRGRR